MIVASICISAVSIAMSVASIVLRRQRERWSTAKPEAPTTIRR